jgi:hypothetical protein
MTIRAWFARLNKPLLILLMLPLAGVIWLGWSYYDRRYPSWYEEVQLLDGRVITIHQKRQYFEDYGTNQSWVTIDLPELGGKQVWHSYLMPQRVDVVDGKVYVFGRPRGDRQLTYYRYPKYMMVGFVWDGANFQRVPYLSLPEKIRQEENVLPCLSREFSGGASGVSIQQKGKVWCAKRDDSRGSSKFIDLIEYKKLADEWAAIPRWEDKFRSE